jgi:hypothetical protein
MRVRIIDGKTLPRWTVALDMSGQECTRMDYSAIQHGEVRNIDNQFALWLIAQGYCEHRHEESE